MTQTEKRNSSIDRYNACFASTLRWLMAQHGTTQKELAQFVGIRPQSLAQYCSGDTTPNGEKLLKIAEYYHVTTDYLLTGIVVEDIPVREMLGLSEQTVENMRLVKDGYFEDTPAMLSILDRLLGDKDFYIALEKAATYYGMARQHNDSGEQDERAQFYKWKAEQYMQGYLLEFFSK